MIDKLIFTMVIIAVMAKVYIIYVNHDPCLRYHEGKCVVRESER